MNCELAVKLYATMVRIRRFEEKLYELFLTRPMPGSMHQYNGQEAIAAGVCAHLNRDDYVTSTHRGHGHCIAKGADLNAVMAEMTAKATGCCRGMGGSMHIADFGVGMLGANAIVAAGIPIAVGAAWTCQYLAQASSLPAVGQVSSLPAVGQVAKEPGSPRANDLPPPAEPRIAVAFFGDGAANEGAFHEALNLAAVWGLPVVFVCENNLYGFSTHYRRTMLLENIADRAGGYGMPGVTADGMDVSAVYRTAGEAVRRARGGGGPTLLEYKTYRYMGHSRFEASNYRTKEEVAEWKERDPLPRFRQQLVRSFTRRKAGCRPSRTASRRNSKRQSGLRKPVPIRIPRITGNTSFSTIGRRWKSAVTGGRCRVRTVQPNAGASRVIRVRVILSPRSF